MGAEPSKRLKDKVPPGWLPVSHAESILAIPQLELVAGCDPDEERRDRHGKYYGIEYLYADYKDLLDEIKPDFLTIATRTQDRTEIINYACKNNVKIIYFEKPVSRSLSGCRQVLRTISDKNVIIGYGVNRRYHAMYRKAKEVLKSGEYGALREVIVEYGKSNLFWTHPHSVDIILFYSECTEIEFIQGTCSFQNEYRPDSLTFIDDDPIIDNAYFLFKNGIKASINQAGGLNVKLACTNGTITIFSDGLFIEARKGKHTFNETAIIKEPAQDGATVTAFKELIEVYNSKNATYPILLEEIETGLLMLAGVLFSSMLEGKRVLPTDIPEDMVITGKSGNFYA